MVISLYERIFSDLFITVFTPSLPIALRIQKTMAELFTNNNNGDTHSKNTNTIIGTGTGTYSACHYYRTFYGIKTKRIPSMKVY